MEIIKTIAFVVFTFGFGAFVFGDRWFQKEIKRNDAHEAPSDQQIRWHILHMRQDIHALVLINYALITVVVGIVLLKN
jgi:hypothetical protein